MLLKTRLVCCFVICTLLFSCSLTKNVAMNAMSDALSGADKKGVPPKKVTPNNTMLVLTGENDPVLVADFFPTALKMYEIMQSQNPKHQGLATMTGSLFVMYANAFIQQSAEMLPIDQFDKQNAELKRAKLHYLRGRDYALNALNARYPGFMQKILSGKQDLVEQAVFQLKATDADAVYWAGAGWLGAFSLEPLDPVILSNIEGAAKMLEQAAELSPNYSAGAIWDLLTAFYAGAPAELGGGTDKALAAHEQALRASDGKTIGPYITYATAICIPANDGEGFDKSLEKALAINPDDNPSTRLASTIAHEKALWLLENRENYFFEW